MSAAALPTETVACPACGGEDATPVMDAPPQLVDLSQTFRFVRCASCDLVYLENRVRSDAVAALYDADYPLHRGPELWGPFAPLVARDQAQLDARRVRMVLAHRSLSATDTVLDVGCGRPTFLAALERETGCRAIGLDLTEPPTESVFDRVRVHRAMPPDWPQEISDAAPLSVVTMWHYLEHEPDPIATLRWLRERMRPDGITVVEVPDFDGATARWMGRWWPGLHTPRHASVFTRATLQSTAERAGWRVLHHDRTGTLQPFVLVALGALDRAGFRFGRHPAPPVFPLWAAAMALTWPWLGRSTRRGMGLQTAVLGVVSSQ